MYDANLQEILDPTQIYSGMYGRVNVRFYAFSNSGNVGIACALNMVQKLQDGEPLSGSRITAEEAFGQPAALGAATAPGAAVPATVPAPYTAPAVTAAPYAAPPYPGAAMPGPALGGVDPFTGLPL